MNRAPLPPLRRKNGFTIFEVMMAVIVMALAISTSITVMEQGMRCIDTARNTTIASQLLQSALEDFRLQTWTQIEALRVAQNNGVAGNVTIDSSFTGYDATAAAVLQRFTLTRTIADTSQAGMRTVTFTATWIGIDGRSHSVNYTSYYAQNGLYDYYVS